MKTPLLTFVSVLLLLIPAAATKAQPIAGRVYFIRSLMDNAQYVTETADGRLIVSTASDAERQFWTFVGTGRAGEFYLRNTATGRYIGSCNLPAGAASRITTTTSPVAYYVWQATSGGVKGGFRLTSTDCTDYKDTGKTPRGLNKDGSSSNVIAYHAGLANKYSYWTLTETPDRYDPRPFELSPAIGSPRFTYTLTSATHPDRQLGMTPDGRATWHSGTGAADEAWYFVGESNRNGGFLMVSSATGRALTTDGTTAVRWTVAAGPDATYYFRPYAADGAAGRALTVEGDSLVTLRAARSAFARTAGIYDQPCGALGPAYVSHATITGDDVVAEMAYPLPTVNGNGLIAMPEAGKPSTWYVLYTQDRATVVPGRSCRLNVTLNTTPAAGTTLTAYADWDGDGLFETTIPMTAAREAATTIDVPATARIGRTRLRLRLTDNGLSGADDEVSGEAIDFALNVGTAPGDICFVYALSNDSSRGTATITAQTATDVTVTATPRGNARFVCWMEGRKPVSTDATYTFGCTRSRTLVACFTPNTEETPTRLSSTSVAVAINVALSDNRSTLTADGPAAIRRISLFTANGARLGSARGNRLKVHRLQAGTYLVHVETATGDAAVKLLVR